MKPWGDPDATYELACATGLFTTPHSKAEDFPSPLLRQHEDDNKNTHKDLTNMAYSGRMSMAPRGSQQPSSQPRARKEDNEDAFMTLVSPAWSTQQCTNRADSSVCIARSRDCRMYQRHWYPLHHPGPAKAQPTADPESLRMASRAVDEHNARSRCACHEGRRRRPVP